jgi:hypothetical protein
MKIIVRFVWFKKINTKHYKKLQNDHKKIEKTSI